MDKSDKTGRKLKQVRTGFPAYQWSFKTKNPVFPDFPLNLTSFTSTKDHKIHSKKFLFIF